MEAWKYSDLRNAVKSLSADADGSIPETPFAELTDAVVFKFDADGVSLPDHLPRGMRIITQPEGLALAGAEDLPVAALSAALATSPGLIQVELSEDQKQPIHLHFATGAGTQFSRIAFVVREGVSATVYESHVSRNGFSSNVTEYTLEPTAKLNRTVFQRASADAVQVFTCRAMLTSGSEFTQTSLGFGGKLCRNETHVFHRGAGGNAVLNAAYLVGDGYHYDLTSNVRHSRGECTTSQLTKGAVDDGGQSVFQGKFYVARNAQKTSAEMGHHALILRDGGEVNAKPELEIYADDVECAHGNTVGAIDMDALFYLRQRGITETEAKSMLTEAFIREALDDLPEAVGEAMIREARIWLTQRL